MSLDQVVLRSLKAKPDLTKDEAVQEAIEYQIKCFKKAKLELKELVNLCMKLNQVTDQDRALYNMWIKKREKLYKNIAYLDRLLKAIQNDPTATMVYNESFHKEWMLEYDDI